MKNLFIAFSLTVSLAAISFGQTVINSGETSQAKYGKPRMAVLEFTSNAPATQAGVYLWVRDVTRISAGIVEQMAKDKPRDNWVEIPSTSQAVKELYQKYLGRPIDLAGAVSMGKLLEVDYIVTGHVKLVEGRSNAAAQMVDVASGKVVWTGKAKYNGTTPIVEGTLKLSDTVVKALYPGLKAIDLRR